MKSNVPRRAPASPTTRSGALPLVAITRTIPTPTGRAPAIDGARVKMAPSSPRLERGELLKFIAGAGAVITMFHDRVDAEFLDAAGARLRGVCNYAVGIDNIDVEVCRARGVTVTNTPDAVTEGTANLAWALILGAARRVGEADRFVRAGNFVKQGAPAADTWLGVHLAGQTLAIIGAGRIGKAVALRGLAFGMRIVYVARERHLDFELAPLCAARMELDDALAAADVVSLHTPLTAATRGLINARRLRRMKHTAVLVNTARGAVIDEAALVEALKSRRIFAAGLDVFEREPEVNSALYTLDNVLLTPHIGSAERKWREVMTELVCGNAGKIVRGEKVHSLTPAR
ncbi:glyoxylate reductase [soil metagenome]